MAEGFQPSAFCSLTTSRHIGVLKNFDVIYWPYHKELVGPASLPGRNS